MTSVVEAILVVTVAAAAFAAVFLIGWLLVVRRRHDVFLAPFHVAGKDDDGLGVALTNMLAARLEGLQRELRSMREFLTTETSSDAGLTAILAPDAIGAPRAMFDPVNVDVSIGKVSVGGLVAWLQRWAVDTRTLRLTVYYDGDCAIVSGTLAPFGVTKVKDIWLETTAAADDIVKSTASALLQSRIVESESSSERVRELQRGEFDELLGCLGQLAELRRRTLAREDSQRTAELARETFDRLDPLARRFPQWPVLRQLTINVAELGQVEAPAADEPVVGEDAFVRAVQAFTERLLPGEDPPPTTVEPIKEGLGILAMWNEKAKRYEVDPAASDRPEMPGYVALMGRFMLRHYLCVSSGGVTAELMALWNDFRISLVDYLLETDPEVDYTVDPRMAQPLYRALMTVDDGDTREGLRKVALTLLDRFDCSWTMASLGDHFRDADRDVGAELPDEALQVIADATAKRTV
jgi:hypothetical protein